MPASKQKREVKQLNVRVPIDVLRFFNQRRQLERYSVQDILERAIVAYIVGDFQPTRTGYKVPRAESEDEIVVVIDPTDEHRSEFTLAQAGFTREVVDGMAPAPADLGLSVSKAQDWGARDLQRYLETKLSRQVPYTALMRFLKLNFGSRSTVGEGKGNSSWEFSGPHDPVVRECVRRMADEGVYSGQAAYRRGDLT